MEIKKAQEGSLLSIAVIGEINSTNAGELSAAFSELDGVDRINLDLAQLAYISSAGLRSLLRAEKSMKKTGGKMVVTNVQSGVMDIFTMTGFSKLLTIE